VYIRTNHYKKEYWYKDLPIFLKPELYITLIMGNIVGKRFLIKNPNLLFLLQLKAAADII
jgi:hypothetical protein